MQANKRGPAISPRKMETENAYGPRSFAGYFFRVSMMVMIIMTVNATQNDKRHITYTMRNDDDNDVLKFSVLCSSFRSRHSRAGLVWFGAAIKAFRAILCVSQRSSLLSFWFSTTFLLLPPPPLNIFTTSF